MESIEIGGITFTNIKLFLKTCGIISFSVLCYILFHAEKYESTSIIAVILPIIFGIIYENRKLENDWKTILLIIYSSFLLSLVAFIPNEKDNPYDFENHVENWPYAFIFIFVFISIIVNEEKATPKLTEGITLIQSTSLLYWIFDLGYDRIFGGIFTISIIGIFSCFSYIHAFTYLNLSKRTRLVLSLWSSVIMIVFAIDYIMRVIKTPDIINVFSFDTIAIAFEYFMLGICLIYILQNTIMLIIYTPTKHRFFNKRYMSEISEMNESHVKRYSENQVKRKDSLIVLLYTSIVYALNFKFQIIPSYTLIWIVFWTFPAILVIINNYIFKKTTI